MPDIFVSPIKNSKIQKKNEDFSSPVKEKLKPLDLKEIAKIAKKELKESKKVLGPESFKPSVNPVSSFRFYPNRADFVNKDPQEKVVLLLRRHPITNLPWILIAFFLILIPPFASVMPIFENMPMGFQVVTVITWYLLIFAFIFEKFLTWFFNVNIITDERVFDVDFFNLVYREITDAEIEQIQDVTVKVGSPIRTVFNYGDVLIQTAAELPQIQFEAVPKPDMVARALRELRIEEEVERLEGRIR